jgi:hypothetical protein
MAENPAYYRDRAREQREAAEAAILVNVRNRCIQAAESWERMAERGEGIGRRQAERMVSATTAE